jgi:hypothetical protein
MILNWNAMQNRICPKCIDGNRKGDCLLSAGEICPLKESFSEIITTVQSVEGNRYEDYVAALRANVCSACRHQEANGVCLKRNHLECALDRYFPLVIDVIDAARAMAV